MGWKRKNKAASQSREPIMTEDNQFEVLNRQLKKVYEDLGREYVCGHMHRDQRLQELSRKAQQLADSLGAVAPQLRSMTPIVCPDCGEKLASNMHFCMHCGRRLTFERMEESVPETGEQGNTEDLKKTAAPEAQSYDTTVLNNPIPQRVGTDPDPGYTGETTVLNNPIPQRAAAEGWQTCSYEAGVLNHPIPQQPFCDPAQYYTGETTVLNNSIPQWPEAGYEAQVQAEPAYDPARYYTGETTVLNNPIPQQTPVRYYDEEDPDCQYAGPVPGQSGWNQGSHDGEKEN